jgi:hypothetical protein
MGKLRQTASVADKATSGRKVFGDILRALFRSNKLVEICKG